MKIEKRAHLYESRIALPLIFELDKQDENDGKLDLVEERARLASNQADKVELEVATMRGELIPAEEVVKQWGGMISAARAVLLALPSKVAPKAIASDSIKDIEAFVSEEIHRSLYELETDAFGDLPSDGDEVETAATADG